MQNKCYIFLCSFGNRHDLLWLYFKENWFPVSCDLSEFTMLDHSASKFYYYSILTHFTLKDVILMCAMPIPLKLKWNEELMVL